MSKDIKNFEQNLSDRNPSERKKNGGNVKSPDEKPPYNPRQQQTHNEEDGVVRERLPEVYADGESENPLYGNKEEDLNRPSKRRDESEQNGLHPQDNPSKRQEENAEKGLYPENKSNPSKGPRSNP